MSARPSAHLSRASSPTLARTPATKVRRPPLPATPSSTSTADAEATESAIAVSELKPGDVFDWPGGSWHGPSVVREASAEAGHWRWRDGLVKIVFDNPRVVNAPGVWYGHPASEVFRFDSGA